MDIYLIQHILVFILKIITGKLLTPTMRQQIIAAKIVNWRFKWLFFCFFFFVDLVLLTVFTVTCFFSVHFSFQDNIPKMRNCNKNKKKDTFKGNYSITGSCKSQNCHLMACWCVIFCSISSSCRVEPRHNDPKFCCRCRRGQWQQTPIIGKSSLLVQGSVKDRSKYKNILDSTVDYLNSQHLNIPTNKDVKQRQITTRDTRQDRFGWHRQRGEQKDTKGIILTNIIQCITPVAIALKIIRKFPSLKAHTIHMIK